MESQSAAIQETPQPKGALWRLQGIFFEPSATFEDINLRPGFIVPIIVGIVVAFATWQAVAHLVDLQQFFIAQMKSNPQTAGLTPEQMQTAISWQVLSIKYIAPVFVPIMALLFSAVFMLMVWISGSETTFTKLLGVVSYTMFFYGLVTAVLLIATFALAQDPYAINLQNPVFTNLGPLVDMKTSPILHRLASSVDIISIYVIYLFGLGISKVARRITVGKGVVLVVIPYLVYLGIVVGITALTAK